MDEAAKSQCSEAIATTREFMEKIAEKDKTGDRSGVLALLELEKRARANGLSSGMAFVVFHHLSGSDEPVVDESAMVGLMERYFHLVGDKACCYEDMKPYISLPEADLPRWTSFLESIPVSSVRLTIATSDTTILNQIAIAVFDIRVQEVDKRGFAAALHAISRRAHSRSRASSRT